MHYYGGKYKSGKDISNILKSITNEIKIKGYIEPFCGALGVMRHMTNNYFKCYAFDGCEDIILLWKSVQNNKFKKPNITKNKWLELKKTNKPSALRAYAGFGLSYGGRWFSAYSQDYFDRTLTKRNQNDESYNSINNKIKNNINNVIFEHRDYKNHLKDIEKGGYLIYCDPPYVNSFEKHKGSKHKFDCKEFWDIIKKWKNWGNIIVVSERKAPKEYKCIWSKKIYNSSTNKSNETYTDKLYINI